MGYRAPYPAAVERLEYIKIYFHCEIVDTCHLPPLALLQLRRELLRALAGLTDQPQACRSSLKELLQPGVSSDPVQRSQVQKPAPAMVAYPDLSFHGLIEPGRRLVLPVLLIGSGIMALEPFVRLVAELGRNGLYRGRCKFRLEALESEDNSGLRAMLTSAGVIQGKLAPPINQLSWWLERQPDLPDPVRIRFVSPLRLLRQGRPLFKADFDEIFPFLLRRVSSLLAAHSGEDFSEDATTLIQQAAAIQTSENRLTWHDWRTLQGARQSQQLGGLLGHLTLSGPGLAELAWVIRLGGLFNVGKGAPYGAGQYSLHAA
jgi:hypothetical protein